MQLRHACIAISLFGATFALNGQTTWTGAVDSNWSNPANWSNGLPSDSNQPVIISADGANVTTSASGSSRNLTVSGNGGSAPVLNITHNITNNYSPIYVGSDASGSGYGGIVNHTAGTVSIGGGSGTRRLHIAARSGGGSTGNSGIYNFGGVSGSAPVFISQGETYVGTRPGESGVLALTGYGSFTTAGLVMSQFNGQSVLDVTGGNLSINIQGNMQLSPSGGGTSTLNMRIDNSGLSTIHVDGNVQFDNGGGGSNTLLNLSFGNYRPVVGTVYTVIAATGIFTGDGAFSNVLNGSTLSIDGVDLLALYDGGNFTLEVTSVIPEANASVFALVVAAIGFLVMRRR